MNYYIDCITKKYCCFEGRARRSEYWMFVLFNIIAGIIIGLIGEFLAGATSGGLLTNIYYLAVLIPACGVQVRRLHDTDRSGWWILIGIIPLIGGIVLLVFNCIDSQPGENRFGPNPKGNYPAYKVS